MGSLGIRPGYGAGDAAGEGPGLLGAAHPSAPAGGAGPRRCAPEQQAAGVRRRAPRRAPGPGLASRHGIRPAGHPAARQPPAFGPEAGPPELSTRSSAGRGLQPRPRRGPAWAGAPSEAAAGAPDVRNIFPGRRGEGRVPRKRRQTTAKGRFARTSNPMLARTPAQTTDRCYFRDPRCGRGARRVLPEPGCRLSPALYNPAPGPGAAAPGEHASRGGGHVATDPASELWSCPGGRRPGREVWRVRSATRRAWHGFRLCVTCGL